MRLIRTESLPQRQSWLGLKPIVNEGSFLGFQLLSQEPSRSKLPLPVAVVHTNREGTRAALRAAQRWVRPSASIPLIVLQRVPFPSALSNPLTSPRLTARRMARLASSVGIDTDLRIFLCRDRLGTLRSILQPHSLVLLGGGVPLIQEGRLSRALREHGHELLFVPI